MSIFFAGIIAQRIKMTSTLPNMSFSSPTSSCRANKISNVKLTTTMSRTRNTTFCNNVKAMATGDETSLQRAKQSLKKKLSQASPRAWSNQFPVASPFLHMMDAMDRIVEDPLVHGDGSPWNVKRKFPWLIKEGQDDYKVRFNMPGMNKNDVKVWIEEKTLVVKAEKVATEKINGELSEENEDWPAKSYGWYRHRICLPENIEFEKIKAEVKDGVLYVTIPKAKADAIVIGIDVQ